MKMTNPRQDSCRAYTTHIFDLLYAHYGDPRWWPAKTPYEVIVGAVLTQNTAWGNVEKAIANFGDQLTPEYVLSLAHTGLAEHIRPAGFFNQKAVYLQTVTGWFAKYGCSVEHVCSLPLQQVRQELLALKGVGRETADSILLYAFGFPTFVVDAYTMRLVDRLPLPAGKGYEAVKAFFEENLVADTALYNRYHALIVKNGSRHCRKQPKCEGCPVSSLCKTGACAAL